MKLHLYLGDNLERLVQREDEDYVFRLHRKTVFYLSKAVLDVAEMVGRDALVSAGTCIGKFTKSNKFRVQITFLDQLAKHCKFKIWLKPGGEQVFLYGNNVLKTHIARMTEGTPRYAGVVVFSLADVALGFGRTGRSTEESLKIQPHDIVLFHQADIGEYIRSVEDTGDNN